MQTGTPEDTTTVVDPATNQEVDWKAAFENAEKRRKDTQAAFTKAQQTALAAKAELSVLKDMVKPGVSDEELKALDELMYADPKAWRLKVNSLELAKNAELQQKVTASIEQNTQQSELERRTQALAEFNVANPEIVLTDEVIQFDVPRRITSKLEKGEVSFEDFLAEVKEYLIKPKKVNTTGVEPQPNLGDIGGGSTPNPSKKALANSYEQEIF